MKTSNKILIGFFIVIFLVPFFVLMSFSSKIKKGQFTVVKREIYEGADFRSGSFKPYKVVKVIAPPGRALKCNMQYSDSLYYSYNKMGTEDNIMVYNIKDTVFIKYRSPKTTEQENSETYLNLKLPVIENLIIDNAEVTLDSSAIGNKDLTVEIYGTGLLNLGRLIEERNAIDETVHEFPYHLNQLTIKMNEGEVALGRGVNIQKLNLQVDGAAVLTINDGATIGEMQGGLSEKSSVKASWKYVKRLAALTK